MNKEQTSDKDDLLQFLLDFMAGNSDISFVQQLKGTTLNDLFRILEQLASLVKYTELRRVQNLLVELAIVRDNTLLSNKSTYEARLLKIIKQSGRLGECVSLILAGSLKPD